MSHQQGFPGQSYGGGLCGQMQRAGGGQLHNYGDLPSAAGGQMPNYGQMPLMGSGQVPAWPGIQASGYPVAAFTPAVMQGTAASVMQGPAPAMMQGTAPGTAPMMQGTAPGISGMTPAVLQTMMQGFQQGPASFNPAMMQAMMMQAQQQGLTQPQQAQPLHGQQEGGAEDLGAAFQQCVAQLSSLEADYYMYLWERAGCVNQALHGRSAFEFLSKSGLPKDTLKRIWDLADYQKRHFFCYPEFVVAMKLIYAAQHKQLVSLERALKHHSSTSSDCPDFEGFQSAATFQCQEVATSGAMPRLALAVAVPAALDIEEAPALATMQPVAVTPASVVPGVSVDQTISVSAPPISTAKSTAPEMLESSSANIAEFSMGPREVERPQSPDTEAKAAHPNQEIGMDVVIGGRESWAEWGVPPGVQGSPSNWDGAEPLAPLGAVHADADGDNRTEAWGADFGNFSGSGTSVVVEKVEVNRWAKMSAFDDLLKEDECLGGALVKNELEAAFAADAVLRQNEVLPKFVEDVNTKVDTKDFGFGDEEDDWGGFKAADEPASGDTAGLSSKPDSPIADSSVKAGVPDFFDGEEGWSSARAVDPEAMAPATASVAPATVPATTEDDDAWGDFGGGADLSDNSVFPTNFEAPGEPPQLATMSSMFDNKFDIEFVGGPAPELEEVAFEEQASCKTEQPEGGDQDWAAFGEFASQPGVPLQSPILPKLTTLETGQTLSFDAPLFDDEPAAAGIAFAALAQPAQASFAFLPSQAPQEASLSPDEEAAREMARNLARLGYFSEAQRCKEYSEILRRLARAESKKRDAVSRDDFEGAIKIKGDINALAKDCVPERDLAMWRRLVASSMRGDPDGLDSTDRQIRERCQFLDDALSRAAIGVALQNFKRCRPATECVDLSQLSILLQRQLQAKRMARSLEALNPARVFIFLQVLLASATAVAELLTQCSERLEILLGADWSHEERCDATAQDTFQDLLRGLAVLRRILWRMGACAEVFLPNGDGALASALGGEELPEADAAKLKDTYSKARLSLAEATALWSQIERQMVSLSVNLPSWDPCECFECGGGHMGLVAAREPLCALCLLPTIPLGGSLQEIVADEVGAASTAMKGGIWHVTCANFWLAHGAGSKLLESLGVEDPFG